MDDMIHVPPPNDAAIDALSAAAYSLMDPHRIVCLRADFILPDGSKYTITLERQGSWPT